MHIPIQLGIQFVSGLPQAWHAIPMCAIGGQWNSAAFTEILTYLHTICLITRFVRSLV